MSAQSDSVDILEIIALVLKIVAISLLLISLFTPWLRFNTSSSEKLSSNIGVTDAEGVVDGIGNVGISNAILENSTWKAKIVCPTIASIGTIQAILSVILLIELSIIWIVKLGPKKGEKIEKISKLYSWDLIICLLSIIIPLIAIGYYKTFSLSLSIYEKSGTGDLVLISEMVISDISFSLEMGPFIALTAGIIWFISAVIQGLYISKKTRV